MERLMGAVWPEAYRVALTILRDVGLAEDAAQEACAAIARALPTLKNTDVFRSWAYKVVVNHAITAARRRPRTETLDSAPEQPTYADRSEALDLYNALEQLTHVQRAAIVLHYYAGLNSREIASATGLPASTVRFHLMLARRTLRRALSTTYIPKEALSDV